MHGVETADHNNFQASQSSERLSAMQYVRAQFKKHHYSPEWVDVVRVAYHKYGLKYLALFLVLMAYSFMGAGVFLFFEKPAEIERVSRRHRTFEDLRQTLVRQLLDNLFNDTEKPIIFVDAAQIEAISRTFDSGLRAFEDVVSEYNSKHSMEPLLRWDLWTALIYAWTVITTIGYGHLFPLTVGGRIATMLYAVVGIPLMLTVLSNVGKLLTKGLKYPFFLVKRWGRRLFRYCTKMTRDQILEADAKDLSRLEVFDLPIPVAIALVIGWIFICSAITLIWEKDWDYLVAFYFFFISLSTIGFGDVVPSQPYYLLVMFGNTLIGMALLSMLLNLIQTKLEPITTDEEEQDPFEMDRSGLRRALRRASMFTNMPWIAQAQISERKTYVGEIPDHSSQDGGNGNPKVLETSEPAVSVEAQHTATAKRKKSNERKKSKPDGMTGGAAASALSSFFAPLFSILPSSEDQAKEATPPKKISPPRVAEEFGTQSSPPTKGPDQLIIIDEDEKTQIPPESDQQPPTEDDVTDRFKPLKKTVSFQASDLASSIDANYQYPEHLIRSSGEHAEPPVALASKPPAATRAIAVMDSKHGAKAVRLHRMEPAHSLERPKKKKSKKQRTMSMREHRHGGETKDFRNVDVSDTDEDRTVDKRLKDSPQRAHRKKHDKVPKTSASANVSPSRKVSSSTFPPAASVSSKDSKRRKHHRRSDTTPDARVDQHMTVGNMPDEHSSCSICAYHLLPAEDSEPHKNHLKKKRSKKHADEQHIATWPRERPSSRYQPPIPMDEPQSQLLGATEHYHQQPTRRRHQFSREQAVETSFDPLPHEEAVMFAYQDPATANDVSPPYHPLYQPRSGHLWHRHSVDMTSHVVPDVYRTNTLPLLPQAIDYRHDPAYHPRMAVRSSETQTMISFPHQDSESHISITGHRGTARLLPESASFTEINRLVNLNIDAEILRNELTALTVLGTATGDISAYQRVLSLQELIDQVNHEASLPRGF